MDLYTFFSQRPLFVRIKKQLDTWEFSVLTFRQLIRKKTRENVSDSHHRHYHIAILCVKRAEYVKLAINNINSLHFHNPRHVCTLYVDPAGKEAFDALSTRLHYPAQTLVVVNPKFSDQPWQLSKIETVIEASKKGMIVTDADGIWRSDFYIDQKKVTLLVPAYVFESNKAEKTMLSAMKLDKKCLQFTHFVSGFVSIPRALMTKKLTEDCVQYCQWILRNSPSPELKRLAEEIAISIAVQENVKEEKITTLKTEDGPGNRKILQSMYFGCQNRILE